MIKVQQVSNVIVKYGWAIYALNFLYQLTDWQLTNLMHQEISSPTGLSWKIIPLALSSMLISVAIPLGTLLLVVHSQRPLKPPFFQVYHQALIEQIRVMGRILSWSILFVIPGLVQLIRLIFVPIIVARDPEYWLGNKDALLTSQKLSSRVLWPVIGILFIFYIFFPLLLTGWDEFHNFWLHPLQNLLITGLQSILSIVFGLGLLSLWEKTNAADVQLERN